MQSIIFLLLLLLPSMLSAENLSVTVYYSQIKPDNIGLLPEKNTILNIIDLGTLEKLESHITSTINSIDSPKKIKQKIDQLSKKDLRLLYQAWRNHLSAREVGIRGPENLPAILFDDGKRKWLYEGTDAMEGYRQWSARH